MKALAVNNKTNHPLTSILVLLSVALSTAIHGIARADQLSPASKITLGVSIVQIQDDPSRFAVYAIDSDHGQILFIDTRTLSVTKSLNVGQNPTSVDIDESGNTLYVANRGSGTPSTYRISLIDLDTQTVATNLVIPGGYLPVNVAAGRQGRLYYNSGYTVWNNGLGRALDADTGDDLGAIPSIKTMMLTSPDRSRLYGQYVYTPNLGQMGVWDISTDAILQTDSCGYSPYENNYGWAYDNYSMSDDGRYLAYGLTLFSSTNLSCQYGVFPELIHALNYDGSRAYGATSVWDTTTFATLGTATATQSMPFACNVMRVDRKDGLLYAFNQSDLSLYILGSTNGISERGSICGLIAPQAANAGGAQWHLLSGPQLAWQSSGTILTNLPVGVYRIEFGSIGDHWVPPSSKTIKVTSDRMTTVSGNYIEKGGVSCTIAPQAACDAGAAWRLTSGYDTSWHQSGEALTNLTPAAYTVRCQHIGGWAESPDRAVTVISGVTTNLAVMYYADGGLSCTIEPQGACDSGAAWRLASGSDTNWHESGEVVTNLEPGNYTVRFQHLDGWVEAPDQVITVISAETNALSFKYYLIGDTHYVSRSGTHHWPYTTWAEAATNIQAAVDGSIDGDSILVTNGVYAAGGAVAPGTYLTNRVMAIKAVRIVSINGPTNTIIMGQGPVGPSAIRCAYLANGSSLSGFTLTNGCTDNTLFQNASDLCGGGVYAEGGSLTNCIITGCSSRFDGAGAYGASLDSCVLSGNVATMFGGGANASTLTRCRIVGNSAASGGGVCNSTLYSCLVANNRAPRPVGGSHGGGAYVATLRNCTVVSNYSIDGGGVCQGTVVGCIVFYNSADTNPDVGTINVGGLTVSHSCTPQSSDGVGNITNEPSFVNLADGDYHLTSNSPCIDKATNQDWMLSSNDLDDTPRISGLSVDMGCYESVSGRGSICGLITPLAAIDSGAQWRLLNGPEPSWQSSGDVLTNMPAGVYTFAFSSLGDHWITPSNQTVALASGGTTNVSGNYVEKGAVSCTIEPQGARNGGAAWRVTSGYDTAWHSSGATVTNLLPGDYTVAFQPIAGWTEAPDQVLTVISGQTTDVSVIYLPYGGISCTIEPQAARDAGAAWRLTSGYDTAWHSSGATVTNLAPDTYTVMFQPIDGWMEPVSQSVQAISGMTTNTVGVYIVRVDRYVCLSNTNPVVPYTNWQTAATGIVDAVNVSLSGDTVWVTNGIYYVTASIEVTNGILIKSVNGAEFTVVDAGAPAWSNRCFRINHPYAVIDGFTLQNGFTTNSGGGVHIQSGTAMNCTITNNSASTGGGAALGIEGIMRGCKVAGNHALSGGGVVCEGVGARGLIDSCYITDNRADNTGGGISIANDCTVQNCLIARNASLGNAGAIFINGNTFGPSFNNCTIVGNLAPACGGIDDLSDRALVVNSIIYGNSNENVNGGFYVYCCIEAYVGGFVNTTNNPQFVDSSSSDYHLTSNSPCIDSAAAWHPLAKDIEGIPRPLDGNGDGICASDIGAYEYVHPLTDSDSDGMSDSMELIAGTSPIDWNDCLRMAMPEFTNSPSGCVLRWSSVTGKHYRLDRTTDLLTGFNTNSPLETHIEAAPPENTYPDTSATNGGPYLYRVGVE